MLQHPFKATVFNLLCAYHLRVFKILNGVLYNTYMIFVDGIVRNISTYHEILDEIATCFGWHGIYWMRRCIIIHTWFRHSWKFGIRITASIRVHHNMWNTVTMSEDIFRHNWLRSTCFQDQPLTRWHLLGFLVTNSKYIPHIPLKQSVNFLTLVNYSTGSTCNYVAAGSPRSFIVGYVSTLLVPRNSGELSSTPPGPEEQFNLETWEARNVCTKPFLSLFKLVANIHCMARNLYLIYLPKCVGSSP